MTLFANREQVCMWFEVIRQHVARSQGEIPKRVFPSRKIIHVKGKLTRRQFAELLFENCIECQKMSAIPHGAFAALKVRQNRERHFLISKIEGNSSSENKANAYEGRELTPLKYNSKLMNSIWGLYNRYSVHNFKKNIDASNGVQAATWGAFFYNASPATTTASVAATAAAKTSQILESKSSLSSVYH